MRNNINKQSGRARTIQDIQLVMFDIDGTLIDSEEYDACLFKQAIKEVLDIEIGDDWSAYRHVTDSGILEEIIDSCGIVSDRSLIHDRVKQRFFDLNEKYMRERPAALREIPGAKDFIRRLNIMDSVAVAIATGGWEETAKLKLEGVGIDTANLILTSSSDAHSRAEIIKLAENRALGGRNAARKTYFGDGIWDKKTCEALNYNFIAIGSNVDHDTRFRNFLESEEIISHLGL